MALTINDVRKKYPQYDHMSDQEIADKMHDKYYSQIPKEEFYSKVGFKPESESSKLGHGIQDAAGALAGEAQKGAGSLLEAGEYVTRKLGENFGKAAGNPVSIPKWNAREFMGLEGENPVDLQKMIAHDPNSVTSKIWGMAPQVAAGGKTLLGQALAAGGNELLTGKPTDKSMLGEGRLPSAIQDSLATMLMGKAIPAVGKLVGSVTNAVRSNSLAKSLAEAMGGGKTLEEHGKDFASNIKKTYEDVKGNISKKYDEFFKSNNLENKDLYPVTNKTGIHQVESREMPNFPSGVGEERYKNALKAFQENPTVKNGHYLQSELASEERMLEKDIKSARAQEKPIKQLTDELNQTRSSRQKLLEKMHTEMGESVGEYKELTKDYLKNVVPYHGDRNLRNIIFGDITNPTKNNFKNIFSYPDEDVKTIMSHLGPKAKQDALFQAIGIQPEDITAKTLGRRIADLKSNGFESHIDRDLNKTVKSLSLANNIGKVLKQSVIVGAAGYPGYQISKSILGD